MSTVTNFVRVIASAAVMTLGAAYAHAEQFKLTLPLQTEWGTAMLPAGDYVVTTSQMGARYLRLQGNGQTAYVLCSSIGANPNGASEIKTVNKNGREHVQELSSVQLGKTFRFAIAKDNAPHTMAFKVRKETAAR